MELSTSKKKVLEKKRKRGRKGGRGFCGKVGSDQKSGLLRSLFFAMKQSLPLRLNSIYLFVVK